MLKKFLVSSIILFAFFFPFTHANNQISDSILVYVNDEVITSEDLNMRMMIEKAFAKKQATDKKQVIQTMIDELLIKQLAIKNGLSIPKKELYSYAQQICKNYGYDFNSLYIKKQITQDALINFLDSQVLINKILEEKISKEVYVTNEELQDNKQILKNSLGQVSSASPDSKIKLSEIVINKARYSKKQLTSIVKKIYTSYEKTMDFKSLVNQFSEAGSKSEDGDLGWFKFSDLSKEIVQALPVLEQGALSTPLETADRVIILKIAAITKKNKDVDMNSARNMMRDKKISASFDNFIRELRRDSYISIVTAQ